MHLGGSIEPIHWVQGGDPHAVFDAHGPVPIGGLVATQPFALGAVLVYQLLLWHRHEHHLDLRVGLKPCLKAT